MNLCFCCHRIPVSHVFKTDLTPFSSYTLSIPGSPPPIGTFFFPVEAVCSLHIFYSSFPSNPVKPVFRHRIVPVEINIGNPAKFECETEDAPNVSFKWFKDGHPIKDGDKYRIISRFSTSSLEILRPTKEDGGGYTCKASNLHGSDECSASLSVTGKSNAWSLILHWLACDCYWNLYHKRRSFLFYAALSFSAWQV